MPVIIVQTVFYPVILLVILNDRAQAGLDNPQTAHILLQKYQPCGCAGGRRSGTVPDGLSPTYKQDCGSEIAYLPIHRNGVGNGQWICVPKPRPSSLGPNEECPRECNQTAYSSVHSACYSSWSTCNLGPRQLLYAVITGEWKGSFGSELSPTRYHSKPCPTKGTTVCWSQTAPLGMTDGGGPQDLIRQQQTKRTLEKIYDSVYPSLYYHPLARIHSKGLEGLDANTADVLNGAHQLLNTTNPNVAEGCWLCLRQGPFTPVAIGMQQDKILQVSDTQACFPMSPFIVSVAPNIGNETCLYKPPDNETGNIDVGRATFCVNFMNVSTPQCAPNSAVFVCGENLAYTLLPANWTGACAMAYLLPDIEVIRGDSPVPVPSFDYIAGRQKRAVQLVPLFVTIGISSALATGSAGLGVAVHKYRELSQQLINDVQTLSTTIQDIQDQIDSLAEIVLQNRRGLDLLTAEQGGICLALQERCCFYANKSGIVRDKIKMLQEDLEHRRRQLAENPLWTAWNGLLPYLLPLLGPLTGLLIVISVGPCIFNRLQQFVRDRLSVTQALVLTQHYQALKQQEELYPMP
ncbi:syncytin-1-like [Ochotona princeps]|uniref:syncytin-1-like n=1 Tax=Ochotona princeps TaxID=9978 RepID=UPI0027152B2F|nr:syncytin-1-like [Ochotona princeps]